MTKEQEDALNMYQAVDSVLNNHDTVWSGNSTFAGVVTELENNIDDIEDLRDVQEADISGVTEDKQNRRLKLEDQTYMIGSVIAGYASVNNLRELLRKTDVKRSELTLARDNELPGIAFQVHKAAADNSTAILPLGITSGMISGLQTSLSDYVDYIKKPRVALTETSAATKQLPPIYDATEKILKEQLDRFMELYVSSHNDFYTEYSNGRIIVNSPTQTRALQVHFEDIISGIPCGHAIINIDGNVYRRSSKKGNIRVQNLSEGAHLLKVTLPGYVTASVDFNVIAGETTKLIVKLVKASNPA